MWQPSTFGGFGSQAQFTKEERHVGGGIYNLGKVTINNSTLSGNAAVCVGCGAQGGGITNGGTATIHNSTLSMNVAECGGASSHCTFNTVVNGGGIFNYGTMTISNSTVADNTVFGSIFHGPRSQGGGIANTGTVTISNSTISGSELIWNARSL